MIEIYGELDIMKRGHIAWELRGHFGSGITVANVLTPLHFSDSSSALVKDEIISTEKGNDDSGSETVNKKRISEWYMVVGHGSRYRAWLWIKIEGRIFVSD